MSDAIIPANGVLLGRARVPGFAYPRVVTVRDGRVVDITAQGRRRRSRDICEHRRVRPIMSRRPTAQILGRCDAACSPIAGASKIDSGAPSLLSPIDLQAVKAAGVTFVVSLLERVIEEQARGDKAKADALRKDILGADRHRSQPARARAPKRR